MKKLSVKCACLLAVVSLLALSSCAPSNSSKDETWTAEKATEWMQGGTWENGLQMKPHPSINAQEFAEQYHKNKAVWDQVFTFLNRKDLDTLAAGTYPIDDKNAYATISEYVPRDIEQVKWESHRKYLDLQCTLIGKEKIGVGLVEKATVTVPYDETKDVAHYDVEGEYYVAEPGTFFLFFPKETHRPGIRINEGDTTQVKKLVIKIKVVE